MLTAEMLAFTYAYNQTRLIPDTINRRIHTHRVECRTARKLYILCFLSFFSLFISILYNVLQNLSLTHDVLIYSGTDAQK